MKQPNHAQGTRAVRRGRNQDRQDQVKCLRNLHGGNEAKAQTKTKSLGSLGKVKAPALHAERDMLFDKWLHAYDNYRRWVNQDVDIYCTNYGKDDMDKRRNLYTILKRHVEELSEQLRTYDDRINAAKTTGALLY